MIWPWLTSDDLGSIVMSPRRVRLAEETTLAYLGHWRPIEIGKARVVGRRLSDREVIEEREARLAAMTARAQKHNVRQFRVGGTRP